MLYIHKVSHNLRRKLGFFVSYFEKDGFLNNIVLCSGQEVYLAMEMVSRMQVLKLPTLINSRGFLYRHERQTTSTNVIVLGLQFS
jgi:predicted glycosyltransferase